MVGDVYPTWLDAERCIVQFPRGACGQGVTHLFFINLPAKHLYGQTTAFILFGLFQQTPANTLVLRHNNHGHGAEGQYDNDARNPREIESILRHLLNPSAIVGSNNSICLVSEDWPRLFTLFQIY